jgi:NADH:ubiquinone oxidoreductase subunit C
LNLNYKLYFKYILFHTNQIFFKYLFRNDKNTNIIVSQSDFYYLSLHFKLSSLFYSTQLVDIFAYDATTNANLSDSTIATNSNSPFKISLLNNCLLVYNFHSLLTQQRFFVFVLNTPKQNINKTSINWTSLNSIAEIFLNANWLEREVGELHGIFFANKKDLRNLMLQYGDTSAPMQKSYPSIGLREIFYDSVSDLLIQNPVTIQF